MPPAPCTTGSTITAASSSACSSTSRASSATYACLERRRRNAREHLARQHVAPQGVHPAVGVAHAHRAERVAVVAAAPGHQPVLARTSARALVLEAHLDRDLDRHRARVGEEHVLEPRRRDLDEGAGQVDRGRVGEAAEHHVAHGAELVADRRVEDGMGVPVHGRPPRRHAVHQLPPVGEAQPHPLGGDDRKRRHERGHRRVRVPYPPPVVAEQAFDVHERRA